jgi:hypothetical protein
VSISKQADKREEMRGETMSRFVRAIQPHLEAHDIEDAEELAIRLRGMGIDRSDVQVGRWLAGNPTTITFTDLAGLTDVLELSRIEADELRRAVTRDYALRAKGKREERRGFDEIVEGFERDKD